MYMRKKRGSPWPAELAGAIVPPRDAAEGGRRQSTRTAVSPAPPSRPHGAQSTQILPPPEFGAPRRARIRSPPELGAPRRGREEGRRHRHGTLREEGGRGDGGLAAADPPCSVRIRPPWPPHRPLPQPPP